MKPDQTPVTTGFALACGAIHLLLWVTGFQFDAIVRAGFIPARWGGDLILPAGFMTPFLLTPATSALLHGGLLHLSFNLVVLLFIGRQIEGPVGAKPLAILLVAGAYAGAAAQWLSDPHSAIPMIGASGAISALIGFYALIFSRSQTRAIGPISSHGVRALWLAVAWIGLQMLIGLAGGAGFGAVAIWAHIGGFLAGLALARPLLRWRFGPR